MTELLIRTATQVESNGRELLGRAFHYNVPQLVRDPGVPAYKEAFDRALSRAIPTGAVPLFFMHPMSLGGNTEPLGVVRFSDGEDGLQFNADVASTRRGDEYLELVNSGATKDVSVGFLPVTNANRNGVTYRTQIDIREMSLVPTGFAAHPGAEIVTVRSELLTPRRDRLQRKLILL